MLAMRGLGCGQAGPNSVAFLTSVQRGSGLGGLQRAAPTGGDAYGMPLKTRTMPSVRPSTGPAGASTVGVLDGCDETGMADPCSVQETDDKARPTDAAAH